MRFPTTSKTLIDRLASGEDQPWREFFERYHEVIRDLGRLRGLTAAESDDLVQEVMKRFLTRSRTFRFDPERARFRTIFARIINGVIIDLKRKRPREGRLDDTTLETLRDDGATPPDRILDAALLLRWREIVKTEILAELRKTMTPLNYSIFETHFLQHLSAVETAHKFGVTRSRVYLARSRALAKLRTMVSAAVAADPELEISADEF